MAKALLYFIFPAIGLRRFQSPSHEKANLVVGGILFLLLAAVLGYHVFITFSQGQ